MLTLSLRAQQAKPDNTKKEVIVVTGTASAIPLEEADRDIAVLPLPDREQPLFRSWFELLETDPALDLRQRSQGASQADLSIRGATFGQTLVLLDGMRLNDVQSAHLNLDIPVPLEAIGSVEVLKGTGSTLYGSDAIGGVVNLRMQKQPETDLRLRAGAGNNGYNEEHLLGAVGNRMMSEQVAVARDFSSGFLPNRDFRNLALSSMTGLSTGLGASSVVLAYSDRPYGADQFYANYPSWERDKSWFAAAHQNLGDRTELSFAFRRHTDLYDLYRYRPQAYENRHQVESWQGDVRRREDLPLHATLSYGVEALEESIDSTNLGSHGRARGSGYVLYDLRALRRYSLTVGFRGERYGSGEWAGSPTVSGGVWISSRFKLRASASRAFRLPSYTDLYYHDSANIGNPNLKPESATSYEGGADFYANRGIRASVTAFQRRDKNGIDYVRASLNDIWRATNFDQLHFTGVEAAVTAEPWRGQRVSMAFAGLRGLNAGTNVQLSKYAFSYQTHSGTAEWRGTIGAHVVARTRVGIVDRLSRSPYGIWDASATRADGALRPYIQIANITSTIYEEIPGVVMPKRTLVAGLEYVLGDRKR